MKKTIHVLFGILILMAAQTGSYAGITNGDFESNDLSGWTLNGKGGTLSSTGITIFPQDNHFNVVDLSTKKTSANGSFQAFIDTNYFNSLNATEGLGVSQGDVETFLGISSGSLSGLSTGTIIGGSAIKQGFQANSGDVLSFIWQFGVGGLPPASDAFNDFAFVSVGNSYLSLLSDAQGPIYYHAAYPEYVTTYESFSYTIPATGFYTLGFGVFDVGSEYAFSSLFLDDVKLTSGNAPTQPGATVVPEPATLMLFGLGLLLTCRRPAQNRYL